jgi:ADP-L-glycero-D-manno-heptose 6-epimerase
VQGFRFFTVYNDTFLDIEKHKRQPSPHTAFARQAANTGSILVFENSDQYVRDFVPVSYVVATLDKMGRHPHSGLWNIGTGETKSFMDVAKEIAEPFGARIVNIPMPEHIKPQYQKYTCADTSRLEKVLMELGDVR